MADPQGEATQLLKRFEGAKQLIRDLGDWDSAASDLQLLKSCVEGNGVGKDGEIIGKPLGNYRKNQRESIGKRKS